MPDERSGDEPTINFDFEKSPHFRVIYVEGGWGGIAPDGMVHCALFNQRVPIPKRVHHTIEPATGRVGAELPERRESREGLYREVEVETIMTPEAAMQIGNWLVESATQSLINRANQERRGQERQDG